jgi:hypothetical protein
VVDPAHDQSQHAQVTLELYWLGGRGSAVDDEQRELVVLLILDRDCLDHGDRNRGGGVVCLAGGFET